MGARGKGIAVNERENKRQKHQFSLQVGSTPVNLVSWQKKNCSMRVLPLEQSMWLGQQKRCCKTDLSTRCRQGKRGTSFGITNIWGEDLGSCIKCLGKSRETGKPAHGNCVSIDIIHLRISS